MNHAALGMVVTAVIILDRSIWLSFHTESRACWIWRKTHVIFNSDILDNSIISFKWTIGAAQSHVNGYRFSLESPQLSLTLFFFWERIMYSLQKKKALKMLVLLLNVLLQNVKWKPQNVLSALKSLIPISHYNSIYKPKLFRFNMRNKNNVFLCYSIWFLYFCFALRIFVCNCSLPRLSPFLLKNFFSFVHNLFILIESVGV